MGLKTLAGVALSLFFHVLSVQGEGAANIPQDPFFIEGSNYRTTYNDSTGVYRIFPESTGVMEMDYEYFSERMDFDIFNDSIMIGAADKLYLLDDNSLELTDDGEITWPTLSERKMSCDAANSNSKDRKNYLCRNHIRLYRRLPSHPDVLYVCGTQSVTTPQCLAVNISGNGFGDMSVARDTTTNLVSPHPDYPSYGLFREGDLAENEYISWSHSSSSKYPYHFTHQEISLNETTGSFTNTPTFANNTNWLDSPYIVDMLPLTFPSLEGQSLSPPNNYNFYYVFLRERHRFSLEMRLDIEPLILSRVVRVCQDDAGVNIGEDNDIFSTFLKARIYCDLESPGTMDNPLRAVDNRYNDLWSVAVNEGGRYYPEQDYNVKMYGAFSPPLTGLASSAICAYAVTPTGNSRGLFDTFLGDVSVRGSDAEQANTERENTFRECDGMGRPAVRDNIRISADDILVIRTMVQIGENPLIVIPGVYITQMAVDYTCVVSSSDRSMCVNQDVLFVGTSEGKVLKIAFSDVTSPGILFTPIMAEEIALDDSSYIKDMQVKKSSDGTKYLFVASSSHIYKLSLERCTRHPNMVECIRSHDPYCVWNASSNTCQKSNLIAVGMGIGQVPPNILQNIHIGSISEVPSVGLEMSEYTISEGIGQLPVVITRSGMVPDGWVELLIPSGGDLQEGVYEVIFSNASNTTTIPVRVNQDDVYTGVRDLTCYLRNTERSPAFLTTREATVRVIDDDGILGQIALGGLDEHCSKWIAKQIPLDALDKAITDNFLNNLKLEVSLEQTQLSCFPDLSFINSVVYRFALIPKTPNGLPEEWRDQLNSWVIREQEIILDDGAAEVKVDSTCYTNILSFEDDFCMPGNSFAGGLDSTPGSELSSGGIAAVILAVGLIAVALVVILLIVIILKGKYSSSSKDPEETDDHAVKIDLSSQRHSHRLSDQHTYDLPDGGNRLEASIRSSGPSSSPTSAVPLDNMGSAVPLMMNGTDSKKTPFAFKLKDPPIGSPSSKRSSTGVLDTDTSGVYYMNTSLPGPEDSFV